MTWDVEPDSVQDANADQIVADTLAELREDGYRFVTVSDLVAR